MCFYATSGSVGAAPAGYYTFEISANSTTLSCNFGITATNGGGLSTTTPGTIGSDQAICTGGTAATISSSTDATNYSSYKWQKSTTSSSSGFSDIASTNSATYSPGVLTQTTYFQRIAIDASAIEYASNVVTITVLDAGTISPQPGSTWTGSSTTFSSNGTTGGTWTVTTSPNGIASITSGGVLTATASGSGTVTYSVNSGSTTCTATRNFNIYGTSGSLPVTWESVSAQKKNSQVFLQWSTASEQNTKDFEIQYSPNTINWNSLGVVQAAGNSSVTKNYSFTHESPLKNNNYNYYRILQRDIDGKSSYSKIVSVIFNEPGDDIMIYPNPAADVLNIFMAEEQEVTIINSAGSTVWQSKMPAGKSQVALHRFSAGVYLLRTPTQTRRFVIK